MKKIDLTGRIFNRLTVVKELKNKKWQCVCSCGKSTIVFSNNLARGHTQSCGCLAKEMSAQNLLKRIVTHNSSHSRLYSIWSGMKQRCLNKNHHAYIHYGGRGITICMEWRNDFLKFQKWARLNGYKDNLTLDRINNNKGYLPKNCRFATAKEQSSNRRDCILYKKETAKDASKRLGGSSNMVKQRVREYGWSIKTPLLYQQLKE
jgi:hypothetical protein